ncbi:MAG: acylphosphatase, partial [Candidatus Methanoperedens sp.]|nr:acylphosphatase [Candidatus Methanoperedens sp.]
MKLKIIITGSKVHGVGYRVMLVNKALSLGINNFNVFNTFLQGNQAVFAVIEGDEDVLGEFKDYVNNVKPEETRVDNISFEDYRNAVPPIERVMQAFQMEQWGKGIPILLKMLEKQDSVIERQDTTIGILKSVKEDTTH